jgi:hypothetical protein
MSITESEYTKSLEGAREYIQNLMAWLDNGKGHKVDSMINKLSDIACTIITQTTGALADEIMEKDLGGDLVSMAKTLLTMGWAEGYKTAQVEYTQCTSK